MSDVSRRDLVRIAVTATTAAAAASTKASPETSEVVVTLMPIVAEAHLEVVVPASLPLHRMLVLLQNGLFAFLSRLAVPVTSPHFT